MYFYLLNEQDIIINNTHSLTRTLSFFLSLYLSLSFSFSISLSLSFSLWSRLLWQLYRLLVQRLVKRYLSVLSASENMQVVAEVYENISTAANHEKIKSFLKEGLLVQPEIFNSIVEYCLSSLLKPYRAFVGTKMGESVRVHMLGDDANAEFMHVVVVLIQNQWRCCRARRRVQVLKEQKKGQKHVQPGYI
jgi:hypothetical protein